jgi:N-methylhydantoinase A
MHEQLFAIRDVAAPVEVVSWRAHARCKLREVALHSRTNGSTGGGADTRSAYFPSTGRVEVPVLRLEALSAGVEIRGPALIESPTTTVVIDPDASCTCTQSGSLILSP